MARGHLRVVVNLAAELLNQEWNSGRPTQPLCDDLGASSRRDSQTPFFMTSACTRALLPLKPHWMAMHRRKRNCDSRSTYGISEADLPDFGFSRGDA